MSDSDRKLTEADVQAILDAAEDRFYNNLGKGLWDLVWKTIIVILVGIAAWGAYHR